MITRIAEFTVDAAEVPACAAAIKAFLAAVRDHEPGTLKYESYRLPDGVSFLHVMQFADEDAEAIHRSSDHVREFSETIHSRCVGEPRFSVVEPIVDLTLTDHT
jgi:quinol monooxygenase YgiN